MFDNIENILLLPVVNNLIKKQLGEVGEVQNIDYSKKEKSLKLIVLLSGEEKPIHVNLLGIHAVSLSPLAFKIDRFESDRPWLDSLALKFVVGKEFNTNYEPNGPVKKIIGMFV